MAYSAISILDCQRLAIEGWVSTISMAWSADDKGVGSKCLTGDIRIISPW